MGLLGSIGTVVGGFTGMPWLSAVGSGLDSFMDKRSSAKGQEDANVFNAQQAQLNRDFQERMRATQYQTTVEDLKKAGLNPMLGYTQGGAGTPAGSLAAPALNKAGAGISSAQQAASTAQSLASLELNKAQIDQVKATTEKIRSETMDQRLNTAKLLADTSVAQEEVVNRSRTSELTFQRALSEAVNRSRIEQDTKVLAAAERLKELEIARGVDTFSADVARRKAETLLTELEIPKSKAEASFWNQTGDASQLIKMLASLFGMGSSARSFLRR